ncbi:acetyltransferase (GNAT) family protein [Permianibacter aggregans]|uniref:Acetyltransferase (GNAT) family protein n=2 Tax=Permianibacter aggregans TaxID=1510150 RepID=A0A4R6UMV1_9GAMM|nr:acetyltransferase (GNAT) family protein [Permianibacter aggregans]
MVPGFRISSKLEEMDMAVIHGYLSQSYWAKDIPLATLQRALQNSLCFGVFTDSGEQVGFARMITDRATFAYLADVFILDAYRGKGLSKWLMQTLTEHPDLQGLRRSVLATRDAHGLYRQFGYTALNKPETFMECWQPDVYQAR